MEERKLTALIRHFRQEKKRGNKRDKERRKIR
jgi:hypothetical protein